MLTFIPFCTSIEIWFVRINLNRLVDFALDIIKFGIQYLYFKNGFLVQERVDGARVALLEMLGNSTISERYKVYL